LMKIFNAPRLQINPSDAERLKIASGQRIRLKSPLGEASATAEIDDRVPPGLVFYPEHFNDGGVKELMPYTVDPKSGVISFKLGAVQLEALEAMG
ncbi:MAG TPA: molybdopterin dinucleotide binding domain-containing protein, partial [Nitrospiria bacterium]|nr:molybdopterin dinucleotide binding domain-containing protein [Nitrospiria bacterium]